MGAINRYRRVLPAILVILLAGGIAYANTFQVPFVMDDTYVIASNPVIQDLQNFFSDHTEGDLYPPRILGYLSFALNHHFGGLNVAGYHLVNLFIHLFTAVLAFYLIRLTFSTPRLRRSRLAPHANLVALLVGLLFVVHPVQTQAVTYIVQRMASMTTMFYLLSMALYVKSRLAIAGEQEKIFSRRGLILTAGSVGCAILAMKTKEIAFTLPLAAVLYEACFFTGGWKRRFLNLAPLLATLPVVPISVLTSTPSKGQLLADLSEKTLAAGTLSRMDYLLTQFRVMVTYLRLLVLPVNQNLDYDYPHYSRFFTPPVLLSFLLLAALFSLAMYLLWRTRSAGSPACVHPPRSQTAAAPPIASDPSLRLISFGICWYFLTLAVESSLVPLVDVIAEHRLYLPSFGLFAAFSVALSLAIVKYSGSAGAPRLILGTTLLLTSLFGFATYQRNNVWGDGVSLWQDVVAKSPQKARGYNNLGEILNRKGRFPEAIASLKRALELDPYFKPEAYHNLGYAYVMTDRSSEAVPLLKTAIRIDPDSTTALVILGMAYNQLRLFPQTVALLEENLERLGKIVEVHYHLGVAYAFLGDVDAAKRELEIISRFDRPEMEADLIRLLNRKTSRWPSRERN